MNPASPTGSFLYFLCFISFCYLQFISLITVAYLRFMYGLVVCDCISAFDFKNLLNLRMFLGFLVPSWSTNIPAILFM